MDQAPSSQPAVLFFDVNETLLDLFPLKESINNVLLESEGATLWFTTMLQYSLVMTVSGVHAPFPEIGVAALKMLAKNREVVLSDDDAKNAIRPLLALPAHPDVRPGLERLRQAGFKMAALTNSSSSGVKAQLEHAGITDLFDRQLSVESVGKYKPHTDVYRWAAQEMKARPEECMLVAAHGWDVAGAAWAGMQTAFIARPGQQMFPLARPADLIASGMEALAEQLLTQK
jgi:2-haloacid dehalogenase